jgi:glutamine amidotransferase
MQLMCRFSEENNTECMGIFDVDVKRFPASPGTESAAYGLEQYLGLPIAAHCDLPDNAYVYFVHSYAAPVCEYTVASCDYALPFSAMLHKDNFYAAQFHCEISGDAGQQILENFLKFELTACPESMIQLYPPLT